MFALAEQVARLGDHFLPDSTVDPFNKQVDEIWSHINSMRDAANAIQVIVEDADWTEQEQEYLP
jgi:hypothetical protein